jgi:protein-tyrosine phosphatase
MTGYVDIHAHVLPGIDDGPSELDGSLAMLRAAAASGITSIVATPHLRSDFPDVHVRELGDRCASLRAVIETDGLDLTLAGGAEVALHWALEAADDDLRLATYGQRGSDVLIETPATTVGLDALLYELRARDFRVTLAHPERSLTFQGDPSLLGALVEQGVLLQINAATLVNGRRAPSSRLAEYICLNGLAHALASDGHRAQSWRPVTLLAQAVEAASALLGPERARWMTTDAPAAILAGHELPDAPPLITSRRRRFRWPRRRRSTRTTLDSTGTP